jgi:monoterpene epsilon-lactone hydrolase
MSWERRAASDLLLTPFGLHNGAQHYLAGRSPQTPLASRVYADLHGLPPLFIQVGGDELLLDDIHGFAQHAEAAGVTVREADDRANILTGTCQRLFCTCLRQRV